MEEKSDVDELYEKMNPNYEEIEIEEDEDEIEDEE